MTDTDTRGDLCSCPQSRVTTPKAATCTYPVPTSALMDPAMQGLPPARSYSSDDNSAMDSFVMVELEEESQAENENTPPGRGADGTNPAAAVDLILESSSDEDEGEDIYYPESADFVQADEPSPVAVKDPKRPCNCVNAKQFPHSREKCALRKARHTAQDTANMMSSIATGAADMFTRDVAHAARLLKNGAVQSHGMLKKVGGSLLPRVQRRTTGGGGSKQCTANCDEFNKYAVVTVAVLGLGLLLYLPCATIRLVTSGKLIWKLFRFSVFLKHKLKVGILALSMAGVVTMVGHRVLGGLMGLLLRKHLGGAYMHPDAFNISFGWISIRWGLDRNELAISNLSWRNPQRFRHYPQFVKVKHFRVSLELSALYQCVVHGQDLMIHEATLEGCCVYLERDPNVREFNFATAVKKSTPTSLNESGREHKGQEKKQKNKELKIQLNRLLVDGLRLHIYDPTLQLRESDNTFEVRVLVLTRVQLTRRPAAGSEGHRRGHKMSDLASVVVVAMIKAVLKGNSAGVVTLVSNGLFKNFLSILKLDKIKLLQM